MSAIPFHSGLTTRQATGFSQVKTILIEPFLIVAVAAFWLIALPFVAASLVCVKVGGAVESGSATQPNPLFLRQSPAPEGFVDSSSEPGAHHGRARLNQDSS
jgi:hypothetical protein